MSRVGKKPIRLDQSLKVKYSAGQISISGQKGSLIRKIHPGVNLDIDEKFIRVNVKNKDRKSFALQGLTRSLINNMTTGVSQGFTRSLQINGIGYRAEVNGTQIILNLGYSHPINFQIPEGISVIVDKNNVITLNGIDKELLGRTAAAIRSLRPPEPYKGKGIKYLEERIQRKAGKTGAK